MADLQPVRGTHDLLPDALAKHDHVSTTAQKVAGTHGYDKIATPIFEFTQVFDRTLGDTSDVVTKEMYTFEDRGGDSITLRPENTAGVARAFMSNGLTQNVPCKYFYSGPMFRYERPQKGRLRQFHQIGIELIGAAQPIADIEVISCGAAILESLGLKNINLELNTLGDQESRDGYRKTLIDYLMDFKDKLSEDSLNRLEKNPLRVLDSKDEGDKVIVKDAPIYSDHLNQESQDFFGKVCEGLKAAGVNYTLNPRLVRGLDYYCHTAFEFTTTELGAQGTVMAGGRYDGLIKTMGGPQTPGVGWAAGIERLSMLANDPAAKQRPVALVPLGEVAELKALSIAKHLRSEGLRVEMGYGGNMKKRMTRANKINAYAAVVLGEDELAKGVAGLKNLDKGEQTEVSLDQLAIALKDIQS
ncbi:histidine--tRNA ligase [Curvivirga aplysinae]|uniref:histidine--tRNA ligase n=1 Tax=Curvivirga aplysinae TaxID=2529852 RepID=UPI0012BBF02B|nr:histidine--tRNA ligase [Curvivirga aplysinae]MTI09161.1 histidine--tRNA ligase [Curvivirga aplysinae]